MNIAVLGAGVVGTTIARRLPQAGHAVVYGARDPNTDRYRELAQEAAVRSIPEAVGDADAVLLTVPGEALQDLLDTYGDALDGKVLLDATNRLGAGPLHQLPLFQERVPRAQVYRAFNTLGWENFHDPVIGGEQVDLFYSGPEEGRSVAESVIAAAGLRPVWVGSGDAGADLLDGVTRLWFTLALQQGRGRHLAFRLLS